MAGVQLEIIDGMLDRLEPREAVILRARYGLEDGTEHSRREIATRLGVSAERVRQMELAALRRFDELGELDAAAGWDADRWADAIEDYFDEYDTLGVGPDARGPGMLAISEQSDTWTVRQTFTDR